MKLFIGRDQELEKLKALKQSFAQKGLAQLVVIKGRRRIGKSRLAAEFAKGQRLLSFTGVTPTSSTTHQKQLDNFAFQLRDNFNLPPLHFEDWSQAFANIEHYLTTEPTVLLFDEISWMCSKDSEFIGKLKAFWDLKLQNRPNLTLIFCGSVSTWIEENIINSTSFFGRIAMVLDLQPLSLPACGEFLKAIGFKGSIYDQLKILSVTGGVPWYLEQIDPREMADDNIKRLCFLKDGPLEKEFDRIFTDLFHNKGDIYKKILSALADGMKTQNELRVELAYAASGTFSGCMNNLVTAGFVTKHYQWSLKTGKISRSSLYRLSDPYCRFYMHYIEPNKEKIDQGSYADMSVSQLSGWDTMMGYQVESLLLYNRPLLLKAIGITASDIVGDNPYRQVKTTRQKGCQIDYLIQTQAHNLFLCEFKFKRRELGLEIIEEVQEKITRFSAPRNYGVAPVLVHLGGVSSAVDVRQYFYKIIDIADLLDPM